MIPLDSIVVETMPDKPKPSSLGDDLVLVAFLLFFGSWPIVLLTTVLPGIPGSIGEFCFTAYVVPAFLCGPIPIIPAALFFAGLIVSGRRR